MSLSRHFNKTEDFGFSDATLDNQPLRQFRLTIMMIGMLALVVVGLGWSARFTAMPHGDVGKVLKATTRAG